MGANDIRESGFSGESIYFTGVRRIYEIINIGSCAHFVQGVLQTATESMPTDMKVIVLWI